MRKIRSTAIVLSMLLALGAVPRAHAQDTGGGDDPPTKVLKFVERSSGNVLFLDLGTPRPSLGDRLVFSNSLFDANGAVIGRDGAECTIVSIDATAPPDKQQIVQCVITVQLADGQITVQSLAQGTDNVFAVTGGTGAYRNARGEAHVRDIIPLVEAEITVFLNLH